MKNTTTIMQSIKKPFITVAGFLAFVGLVSIISPLSSRGQGSSGNNPPAQSVTVVNTPDAPVPVRDVDKQNRQPVSATVSIPLLEGESVGENDLFQVPVGKLLVIEYVTARVRLAQGQSIENFGFSSSFESVAGPVFLQWTDMNSTGTETFFASQSVKVYADRSLEQGDMEAFIERDSNTGTGQVVMTIFGYLVDVPSE
jgi:hypothetical protein